MTDEAAKTAVFLMLRSAGEIEPADLMKLTGMPLDVVTWALDRLREEEKVRCRVGRGREWWQALYPRPSASN